MLRKFSCDMEIARPGGVVNPLRIAGAEELERKARPEGARPKEMKV